MAAEEEDSLYVLTAVLLTPAQFPSVLGDDYPAACAVLGLEPYAEGYGLVLGQDGTGARWTVVTEDVTQVACAVAAWDCGMEADLSPDERDVAAVLPGWPLSLAVSAPGLPEPHDPVLDAELDTSGPVLSPPDTSGWGPAQRRLGADEIALQWAQWRAQVEEDVEFVESGGEAETDTQVQRVLEEVRAYLETPPPPGRIRSAFASGDARTLRADGPGWSVVARTDDIAFVLLDEAPGEVRPVGRGRELPELLSALDGIALRPAA
ncbi:hypothetical protein ACH4RA_03210 [Streptomyces smyrnaeus]|uniref:hypothetical protein n=1 Tax=Streptomyces TaxID=1883 RepID=UPI000C182D58|nr:MULTISPECIES: hypothetical protein [unclassified Streptomyces]MBQ0868543.1 hypothetical protein [Streptomyces sp. RK75]MBQ1120923.1 hypothetical protein [Streptomyces sp. B15]MBQ1156985.1 hypothetical protein [Streptomyces sp. A73]